ncbi:porin [Bradyrhizobium sp. HKCCYLS20291]|uniref:porin n=1 Tax=Bradyrhizobium sp. HKCCYLS20291 TaxID=3420766 RepID=UPI003EBBD898
MFRSLVVGTIVWLVTVPAASAGSEGMSLRLPKAAVTSRSTPSPGAVKTNPCSSYGANFVRVEGTDTCVKVGGELRVGTGGSLGR